MRVVGYLLTLILSFLLLASPVAAQSTAAPDRQPLRAQLAQSDEPTLREALADEDVRAELRQRVRGLDPNDPYDGLGASNLSGPQEGSANDGEDLQRIAPGTELQQLRRGRSNDRPPRARPAPERQPTTPPRPAPEIRAETRPHLDVELFTSTLDALLQPNVMGYVMQLRQHGQVIAHSEWNWAQRPEDASLSWTQDRRQHVASISKFITAMGLARLLDDEGISFDAPIADYLPAYWQVGPNVDDITFAHLMNHISGFQSPYSGNSNFLSMRARVAQGVDANDIGNWGTADYENMNFGLCRLLIAVISGYADTDADFGIYNDVIWNWISIAGYAGYIHDNVFAPAGVTGAVLANSASSARGYAWDDTGPGMDSGNLSGEAGGAGWHLSANEVLDVVGEFRRGGGIVSPQRAREIMNLSYGLNSPPGGWPAPTGVFYFKPGLWQNGPPDNQAEQAFVMVLPEDMEVVILVNSPLGPQDFSLQVFGASLYLFSVVE